MIDFEWYRSFISIYKHGSVSAAAKARILTQPAMSQHLAALEAELGESLFVRSPRKMIPTEKGKELYTKIVPLIEKLESTSLELRNESNQPSLAPLVKLGTPPEYFTKAAIKEFKGLDLRLSVQFGVAQELQKKLSAGEVDLVITTQKTPIAGIEYQKIEDEVFVVVASIESETESGAKSLEEIEAWLTGKEWLSYGTELPIVRRYWREHFNKRPEIQPSHVIPDLRAVLEAIENNMGKSVLPTYLVKDAIEAGKTKILFPHLSVENTIYLAYKMENRDHPHVREILRRLKR
ncbi:LysR family transcriptional regulator [Bacillus sp. CHD6a]|uniref:LysR family transcriptional regulator n=1 Tax=Bacillus sp. CHD6a TaxID=1643452 RepID=UPI0006CE00E5|nr:LysR family transcriptional regulator [Bacillus sp. CHD6a]KPB06191.1 LysR family transcriptional regulator [Bacillus sp. CHD6a]